MEKGAPAASESISSNTRADSHAAIESLTERPYSYDSIAAFLLREAIAASPSLKFGEKLYETRASPYLDINRERVPIGNDRTLTEAGVVVGFRGTGQFTRADDTPSRGGSGLCLPGRSGC